VEPIALDTTSMTARMEEVSTYSTSPGTSQPVPGASVCRHCGTPLELTVVDLGKSPLCQTVLSTEQLEQTEAFYPLHVRACEQCWLVQIPEFVPPEEIFTEYAYFSAYSDSWVEHARRYVDEITERLELGTESLVVELASNDGYLLQHFLPKGVPVLGVEPAENVAEAAVARGVPTVTEFFGSELGRRLAAERGHADLVLGNNVLAQVPDINDFVAGVAALLGQNGTATFEFPHLAKLIEHLEYDTIYHEHFSYFSLHAIRSIFGSHGLALVDVEELESHGGSLRVFLQHADAAKEARPAVAELLTREDAQGMRDPETYARFADGVRESKRALLALLIELRRSGKQVVGYGAPGKGNTLLNYCGIRTDFVDYTVDRNPYKQGKYTPGTHIPIHTPELIAETKPDVIVVLPWNLAREISDQLAYTAEWGAQLVVPIPTATMFDPGSVPEVAVR
jgi:SAM-dependent methyltransferase